MSEHTKRMRDFDAPRAVAPTPGINAGQLTGTGTVKPSYNGRKAAKAHVRPMRLGLDGGHYLEIDLKPSQDFNPEHAGIETRTAQEDGLLRLINAWNAGMQSAEIRESIEHGIARIEHRDAYKSIEFKSIWRG